MIFTRGERNEEIKIKIQAETKRTGRRVWINGRVALLAQAYFKGCVAFNASTVGEFWRGRSSESEVGGG